MVRQGGCKDEVGLLFSSPIPSLLIPGFSKIPMEKQTVDHSLFSVTITHFQKG